MLLSYDFANDNFHQSGADDPSILALLLITLCISGIIGSILYVIINFILSNKNNHLWEKGIFPPDLKFNRDNLMEAYICLAALLITYDRNSFGEKIVYMKKYFSKYFPNSGVNISSSISSSFKHPIRIKTVSIWLFKNIKTEKDKLQILYFLVGIAKIDGAVNAKERHVLERFSAYVKISKVDFERAVKNYKQEEQQKKQQSRSSSNSNNSKSTYKPSKSKKKQACETLGISEFAKMDEIKRAYRKLVKIHHPDRFHNESEAKQEQAEEKFREIQKAYEFLEVIN